MGESCSNQPIKDLEAIFQKCPLSWTDCKMWNVPSVLSRCLYYPFSQKPFLSSSSRNVFSPTDAIWVIWTFSLDMRKIICTVGTFFFRISWTNRWAFWSIWVIVIEVKFHSLLDASLLSIGNLLLYPEDPLTKSYLLTFIQSHANSPLIANL